MNAPLSGPHLAQNRLGREILRHPLLPCKSRNVCCARAVLFPLPLPPAVEENRMIIQDTTEFCAPLKLTPELTAPPPPPLLEAWFLFIFWSFQVCWPATTTVSAVSEWRRTAWPFAQDPGIVSSKSGTEKLLKKKRKTGRGGGRVFLVRVSGQPYFPDDKKMIFWRKKRTNFWRKN